MSVILSDPWPFISVLAFCIVGLVIIVIDGRDFRRAEWLEDLERGIANLEELLRQKPKDDL